MISVHAALVRNSRGAAVLLNSEKFLAFLESLIDQAQGNVWEYEDFHENRLANIPAMDPMDSFLYGVASGKLQQLEYLKQLVETRMEELGE